MNHIRNFPRCTNWNQLKSNQSPFNVYHVLSVLDPDGVFRTVKYTADKHNGFQAQIITNGQGNSVSHHPAVKPVHEVHNDGGGSGSSSGGGSSNDGEEEDDGEENEIDDDDGGSDTSSEEEDGDDEYY